LNPYAAIQKVQNLKNKKAAIYKKRQIRAGKIKKEKVKNPRATEFAKMLLQL